MKQITEIILTPIIAIFLLFSGFIANAQTSDANAIEMADAMRTSGKIYVVVLVVIVVFCGLLLYTVLIDRKVSRLEKEIRDQEQKSKQII